MRRLVCDTIKQKIQSGNNTHKKSQLFKYAKSKEYFTSYLKKKFIISP